MDKLEIDARLAHVERRVAVLSAILVAGLVLVGVSLFMMTLRAKDVATAQVVATPGPFGLLTNPLGQETHAVTDMSEGSVSFLSARLQELAELKANELITNEEYEAKKVQLLGQTARSVNLKGDLELVAELAGRDIITKAEQSALKAKILGIAK